MTAMTVPVAWLPAKLLTDLHKPSSHVGIRTVAYRVCRSDTMQPVFTQDQLDAAVRAERERCAKIADNFTVRSHALEKDVPMWHRDKVAAAIREGD